MLPYDQIAPGRLAIGDLATPLDEHLGVMNVALAEWIARDDSSASPGARRAANTAMDAIDAMLRELHALRSRLIDETRAHDDATGARVDALLAQRHAPCAGAGQ